MAQPDRNEKREAFYRRLILPWEDKRSYDPFLIWDGSFRWFRSENVVPLERYRTSEELDRIRANVLRRYGSLVYDLRSYDPNESIRYRRAPIANRF